MNIENLKRVVLTFEGSKKTPYVPMKNGKVLDSSGVTIGKGLDLGQQSTQRLLDMGIPADLVKKLAPFIKLKGSKAVDALDAAKEAGTLPVLSDYEERLLNDLVVRQYAKEFERDFEKYIGYGVDNLAESQQLALASMYFQYNVGNKNKTGMFVRSEKDGGGVTNLTKQLQRGEMDKAAGNIATWNDTYRTRNNSTALLFLGAAAPDQIQEAQQFVQKSDVRQSLAKGEMPEELSAPFVTGEPEGLIGTPFERKAPLDRQEPTKSDLQDWQEPGAFKMPSEVYKEQQQLSDIVAGVVDTGTPNVRPVSVPAPQSLPRYDTMEQLMRDRQIPQEPQYASMEELLRAKDGLEYNSMEELLMDKGLMNPLLSNRGWIVG